MKGTAADLGGKENEHFGRVNVSSNIPLITIDMQKSRGRKFGTQIGGEDDTTSPTRVNSPSPLKPRSSKAINPRRIPDIMIDGTS